MTGLSGVTIRNGNTVDTSDIDDLQTRLVKDHYVHVYSAPKYAHLEVGKNPQRYFYNSLMYFEEHLEKYMDDTNRHRKNILVAEIDNMKDVESDSDSDTASSPSLPKIVGYCTYHLVEDDGDGEPTLSIDLLMVHPKYQVKGIGRELFYSAMRSMNTSNCVLYTLRYNNIKTQLFFERLGFSYQGVGVPPQETHIPINENTFVHYRFAKTILPKP